MLLMVVVALTERASRRPGPSKKKPTVRTVGFTNCAGRNDDYFSWLEMLVNVALRLVPRVFTTAMIATEMPAAIRPYSMAVAPLSSFKKRRTNFLIGGTPCQPPADEAAQPAFRSSK